MINWRDKFSFKMKEIQDSATELKMAGITGH